MTKEVSYYAILPAKVRHSKELSSSEKLLFAEVSALSNKDGYCSASNAYLGHLLNITERSVTRQLNTLRKQGFVRVELIREGKRITERKIYPLMDMYGKKEEVDNSMIVIKYDANGKFLGSSTAYSNDKNDHTPIDKNVGNPIDKFVSDKNVYVNNTSLSNNTSINNNIESVTTKVDNMAVNKKESDQPNKVNHSNIIKDIITYLNDKTGKRYAHNASGNKRIIQARLNEGYTLDDFKRVIDHKCNEWLPPVKFSDGKMSDTYLRPATLFNQKFDQYLNESPDVEVKPKTDKPPTFRGYF